jgi:UDP-hydrolysing UDP-N-acetyl-D-glucosamine 2-epimerase
MGESEDRIFVTGAPGLDNLKSLQIPTKDLVERETGVDLSQPTLLCTYHPVTREEDSGESELNGMLSAIRHLELPVVFTYPNADASGRRMISRVKEFVDSCPAATLIVNASQSNYLGLMQYTGAMVGNSSSGIIEAASLGLPVVNIGRRQEGRVRAKNVIDVDGSEQSVANGITKALSRAFRISLIGLVNPYGAGEAGVRIARVLAGIPLGTELQEKAFVDVEPRNPTPSTEGTSCES